MTPLSARFAAELPGWRWRPLGRQHERHHVEIWRSGESRSLIYSGATEDEALLRGIERTLADERERERMIGCGVCRGLGWFIVRDASKQRCHHGDAA